ncbi:MAG: hypothetical protein IT348_20065 [Candidatus Eisenbacteria bacterium]|nr:hypothetical protein [Candidatus Eisenbacteria bacterium]
MNLTTESLLVSPDGFRIGTATPVQRAGARARDGLPLGELAVDPDVIAAFGGAEAVAALPGERGLKPHEFYNVASARTAKTTLAVAAAIVDALSVDLAGLGPGEIPRVSIVSLKLDVADVPFRRLVGTLESSPVLRGLMIGEPTSNIVTLRHPSGRPIEIAVVAGAKSGGSLAARWSAGLIADEAPRMNGREDGVVNLSDALSTIRERLLPGAQIQCIGSPWAPAGPVYEIVCERFGKPDPNVVVMRTNGPAGNPSYWTQERLERLRETDESAWRINALGEFLNPESGLLSPIAVRRNTREDKLELVPDRNRAYVAAVDLSEVSSAGNASTLVVLEVARDTNAPKQYRVALAREWRGCGIEAALRDIAACCQRFGLRRAFTDQYAASANAALARQCGLGLVVERTTASSNVEDYTNLATIIHTDAMELPPDRTFRTDLLAIRRQTTQSGVKIVLPKSGDGRHCDYAPALIRALKHAVAASRAGGNRLRVVHIGRGWTDDDGGVGGW